MFSLVNLLLGKSAKNTYFVTSANVIYGLLLIVFIILASRFLGPEKFGEFSIAIAVFTICFDGLNLGTSQALIRFVSVSLAQKDHLKSQKIVRLIFDLRLIEGIILLLFSYVLGRFIALSVYQNSNLILPITSALCFVGGLLFFDLINSIFQAYEQFIKLAGSLIGLSTIRLIGLIILITTHNLNLISIALVFFAAPLLVSLIALLSSPVNFMHGAYNKQTAQEILHFSKWMALWGVTATLVGRIDILLLGKLTSIYETGIYSVASRVAAGYIIIGGSLSSVLTPKISRIIDDLEAIKRLYSKISRVILVLIVGMVIIAFLANWFIPFLFGAIYHPAVPIFYTLTLGAVFFIASIPTNVTLLSLGHARWIGLLSLIQLTILISVGILLIPQFGGQGAALALSLSYGTAFVLTSIYGHKHIFA